MFTLGFFLTIVQTIIREKYKKKTYFYVNIFARTRQFK